MLSALWIGRRIINAEDTKITEQAFLAGIGNTTKSDTQLEIEKTVAAQQCLEETYDESAPLHDAVLGSDDGAQTLSEREQDALVDNMHYMYDESVPTVPPLPLEPSFHSSHEGAGGAWGLDEDNEDLQIALLRSLETPISSCYGSTGGMGAFLTMISPASLGSPQPVYGPALSNTGSTQYRLLENFQRMYSVRPNYVRNLHDMLADRKQKPVILLVDMDQVPKFLQKGIVDEFAKMSVPVFVVGSANRQVDSSGMALKDNFHFTLAQKTKDSVDAVITMAAATLQGLVVAYERMDDVKFVIVSNDKIFEQVTNTLRQGGTLAVNISRDEATRGLQGARGAGRQRRRRGGQKRIAGIPTIQ